MLLAHKPELHPTPEQREPLDKVCDGDPRRFDFHLSQHHQAFGKLIVLKSCREIEH